MSDPVKVRVLLAEDNPTDALLLREALAAAPGTQFTLTCVETLADCRAQLDEHEFDIALVDLGLPDSSGLNTILALHDKVSSTPVLVLTGLSDEEIGLQSVQQGAQGYLVKGEMPFSYLVRAIRYAVERHHLQRQSREQIEAANAQLEQRVVEHTAELEAANRELEAFAYSVSHDLRAPLRHIRGFAEIIQEQAGPVLDADSRSLIEKIFQSVGRMQALIHGLLEFSRLGRASLSVQRVEVYPLVEGVIEEFSRDLEGRHVEWQVGELPAVSADPVLLRAVLVNLLSNALKFTRGRDPAQIKIATYPAQGHMTICVRDNGVGFDMGSSGQLFGVFQRLHSVTQFEGTGIGLANVKRIVERHGGRIWAEAAPECGAAFFFTLGGDHESG